MNVSLAEKIEHKIKVPQKLSPRISWLRDYYFQGCKRNWNNEYTAWSTGTPWDVLYQEMTYYIVPEVYMLIDTLGGGYQQAAKNVDIHNDFWAWSLPERKAWFLKEVMVNHVPQEVLPGDLIAGARFNVITSTCFTKKESAVYHQRVTGKNGARTRMKWFHDHGYGNAGATSGHLIPGYERVLKVGWKGIYESLKTSFAQLDLSDQKGRKGSQLKAMITAATLPRDLAKQYAHLCTRLATEEAEAERSAELSQMAGNLQTVPWEPARTFWEAIQSLWLTHMLIMSDENYPGPGVSFGRIDQYLLPYWEYSRNQGMDWEFAKEILKCFWFHCNTAYDAMIRNGNQGITAGFGQLLTLSGMGKDGKDMTNELTYMFLEVIDEMTPILEPKPNIRLHRNTPDDLLDKVIDMISESQGSPFLINFDERSMAGMMLEARKANITHLINASNVHEYAPVGCLENTMVGNDRSGTVDINLNLLKAVELAFTGGRDMIPFVDPMKGKPEKIRQDGPNTGDAKKFETFEAFFKAYEEQTAYIIQKSVETYEASEAVRADFLPTPYLSCLVKGCQEKGLDVTQGGGRNQFYHPGGCYLCHDRRFPSGCQIPGIRPTDLQHV